MVILNDSETPRVFRTHIIIIIIIIVIIIIIILADL